MRGELKNNEPLLHMGLYLLNTAWWDHSAVKVKDTHDIAQDMALCKETFSQLYQACFALSISD